MFWVAAWFKQGEQTYLTISQEDYIYFIYNLYVVVF